MRKTGPAIFLAALIAIGSPLQAQTTVSHEQSHVRMWIPAVGQYENGTLFGVASDLEVVMQRPGTGRVYVSTQPLTQVDMQGSARLAVDAASTITGVNADNVDFFFSVKTNAVTIGGPSGGGAMAVAVAALLEGWEVRADVVMTGMINPDGSIGPIGGVLQKLEAADSVGANKFLVPLGQSIVPDPQGQPVDAKEIGRDRYGIEVTEVADLYDAIAPFTGQQLVRPIPTTDPLKDAAYTSITQRLGTNLTDRAEDRQTQLHRRAQAATISGASDRTLIQQQLQTGDTQLAAAMTSQNESKHYLSASQAFQSLVSFGYAEALIAYFEEEPERPVADYTKDYLATTDAFLATIERATSFAYPIAAAELDSFGASEDRLLDAKALQTQAQQRQAQGSHGETLRLSSFARERAESARWWFDIGREVAKESGDVKITEGQLRALVTKYNDAAILELEYAALIAANQPNFQVAQQSYASAQASLEAGRLAATLANLVETFARTSTALVELSGAEPVRARIPGLADAAAYEIEIARSRGIPPIYASSVLELGRSQVDSDPTSAYASMLQARISARTSLQIARVPLPTPDVRPVTVGLANQAPAWIALGAVFAVIALVLILVILNAESRRRTPPPTPASAPTAPPADPPTPPPEPWPAFTPVASPAAPSSEPRPSQASTKAAAPEPNTWSPTPRRAPRAPRAPSAKPRAATRTSGPSEAAPRKRRAPPKSD